MKSRTLLASVALATFAIVLGSHAATTNLLRRVSVQLTVKSQLPPTTNSEGTVTYKILSRALNSSGLIAALGTDTNLTTNGFSKGAYLAFDTVVSNGAHLPPILVVAEGAGTNETLTPVGDDIKIGALGTLVREGIIKTNGTDLTTAFHIRTVDINITNQWSLLLRGLEVRNVLDAEQGRGKSEIHVDANDTLWTLSGYGDEGVDTNSTPVVVTGTLSTGYARVVLR